MINVSMSISKRVFLKIFFSDLHKKKFKILKDLKKAVFTADKPFGG